MRWTKSFFSAGAGVVLLAFGTMFVSVYATYEIFISAPRARVEVAKRQATLVRDDRALIENQRVIIENQLRVCRALKIPDCVTTIEEIP